MRYFLTLLFFSFALLKLNAQEREAITYKVKELDVVQNLAKVFELAPDSIIVWNALKSDTISPPMQLKIYNYNQLSEDNIAINSINYELDLVEKQLSLVALDYKKAFDSLELKKDKIDQTNNSNSVQQYINISKAKFEIKKIRDQKSKSYETKKQSLLTKLDKLKESLIKVNTKSKSNNKEQTINKIIEKTKDLEMPVIAEHKIEKSVAMDTLDLSYLKLDKETKNKKEKKKKDKIERQIKPNLDNNADTIQQVIVGEVEVKKQKKKYKLGDEVNKVRREKSKFYLSRAMMEIDKYDLKKAATFIDKSLKLNPSYTEAYMLKGDVFAKTGYYSKAIKEYEHASILNGTIPQLYYNMGNCFINLNKIDKAIDMMTLAIDVDSSYILAYSGRSSLFIENEDYDNALRDYNSLLEINSYFYPALKGRGICYYNLGEYDKAIKDFNTLLSYEDNDPSVYYHRAYAKLYNSEVYDACMDFLKASKRGYSDADKAIKKYCN